MFILFFLRRRVPGLQDLFLRAGYTTRTAISVGSGFDAARGLTMGLGFRNEKWSLDCAVLPSGELGRSHRFSLGTRHGRLILYS